MIEDPVLLGPPRLSGLPLLLNVAQTQDVTHVYAAFSGGDDSISSLEVARHMPNFKGAFFIDTGINVPGAEARAREICERRGAELIVYRALENTRADGTLDPQDYEQIVLEHGFPGQVMHQRMFDRLKGRAFSRLVRDVRNRLGAKRVMLVSGTRQAESRRRARTVQPFQRAGNTVWAAPLWNWSTRQRDEFAALMKLPRNPYKAQIGISGDCLCGAYSVPGELEKIEQAFPCVGRRLRDIERRVKAQGFPWGWDERPPSDWAAVPMPTLLPAEDTAYTFTCVGCASKAS